MKVRAVVLAAAVCLAVAGTSWAVDTVKVTGGRKPATGRVIGVSAMEVEIEQTGGLSRQIPVNEVVAVFYDDEPAQLTRAREYMDKGQYEAAAGALEKIKVANVSRPEVLQEIEFFTAYCHAQMATVGEYQLTTAGSEMAKFVGSQKGSYHWLKANEVVGDLLVASNLAAKAVPYYEQVGKAPWPDFKMRAAVALGRAHVAQNNVAEAQKAFDEVLAMKTTGELADAQRQAATLGKARILILEKKYDDAMKAIQSIIAKADLDNKELLAQAYNALGTAQRAAGNDQLALFSFLRVETLYSNVPEAHAEALYNLAQLWDKLHKNERALSARRKLAQTYRNSAWANK